MTVSWSAEEEEVRATQTKKVFAYKMMTLLMDLKIFKWNMWEIMLYNIFLMNVGVDNKDERKTYDVVG